MWVFDGRSKVDNGRTKLIVFRQLSTQFLIVISPTACTIEADGHNSWCEWQSKSLLLALHSPSLTRPSLPLEIQNNKTKSDGWYICLAYQLSEPHALSLPRANECKSYSEAYAIGMWRIYIIHLTWEVIRTNSPVFTSCRSDMTAPHKHAISSRETAWQNWELQAEHACIAAAGIYWKPIHSRCQSAISL